MKTAHQILLVFVSLVLLWDWEKALATKAHRSQALSQAPSPCRFALQFTGDDLLNDAQKRQQFVQDVLYWEGQFHRPGIGYDSLTGLSYGAHIFQKSLSFSCHLFLKFVGFRWKTIRFSNRRSLWRSTLF